MRLDCALICDYVNVREGLLNIIGGGVDRLTRPEFPAELGISLAMRVLLHPTELDAPHTLEVRLLREDGGEDVGRLSTDFSIDVAGEQPTHEVPINFPLGLQPLPIPEPGIYSFEILIDGIHQQSLPFVAEEEE